MKNETKVYVGMDVHKDTVMIAVLPEGVREPTVVKRLVARSAWDQADAGPPGAGARRFAPATRRAGRATCWSGRSGVGATTARSWPRR